MSEDNPILSLLSLTKDISAICSEYSSNLPSSVVNLEQSVKVVQSWLSRLDGDRDLPPGLIDVIGDIKSTVETARDELYKWSHHRSNNPWASYVAMTRHMIGSFGSGIVLYLALLPDSYYYFGCLAVLALVVWKVLPEYAARFMEAWESDKLPVFDELDATMKMNAKQLRHFLVLKSEAREERKFDAAKMFQMEDAQKFWCLHFGAEASSVETRVAVDALLVGNAAYERARDLAKKEMYNLITELLDETGDGTVTPLELEEFLQYFGAVDGAADRAIRSILDLGTSPPTQYPWFNWKHLDRHSVELCMPAQGEGTFLIRCTQHAGEFALSFVEADGAVQHRKILAHADGFVFAETDKEHVYPDLQSLVSANNELYKLAFVDPDQVIKFNVGGKHFQCKLELFMEDTSASDGQVNVASTLLGSMFSRSASSGRIETEIFLDRDPTCFQTILNWYRSGGEWFLPPHVSPQLLAFEARYFRIPFALQDHSPSPSALADQIGQAATSPAQTDPTDGGAGAASGRALLTASTQSMQDNEDDLDECERREGLGHSQSLHHTKASLTRSPVPHIVENVPYFHGIISASQAARLVRDKPAGTYLARNSKWSPSSCLVLTVADASGTCVHPKLFKISNSKYSTMNKPTSDEHIYPSLEAFVAAHPTSFVYPLHVSSSTATDDLF